jgi:hypothetical protein
MSDNHSSETVLTNILLENIYVTDLILESSVILIMHILWTILTLCLQSPGLVLCIHSILGSPATWDEGGRNKNLVSTRRNIQHHRFTNLGDTHCYKRYFSTLPLGCACEVKSMISISGAVFSTALCERKGG